MYKSEKASLNSFDYIWTLIDRIPWIGRFSMSIRVDA
jgi:hypothetical protein